jgi:hypothetical protein
MVGEDRKDMPIAGALMKAVNKFPGYEHVKVSLETIPRTRPISFTKLRDVLKNPNATPKQQYAVWAQGFNAQQLGKDWILHLMDISRKGMGITAQPAAPQPVPVAEQRLFNALIRTQKTPMFENAPTSQMVRDLINPQGREAQKYAKFDSDREQRRAKMEKGALADRNSRKYSSEKDDWGNLKKEEFNSEYDDEAGMAQSNLRTMARAVDGLLKTIKNNDNLPEWGQEKIAKAEMMLVSVWDYLQSQKELGMDPKVNESRALAGLKQIVAELSSEKLGQYKKAAGAQASAADKAGNTKKADKRFSGIVKATKKQFANDTKGVAEVSKDTLDRYVTKAVDAHGHADFAARQSKNDPSKRSYHVDQKKTAEKRRQGISRALDRMSKDDVAEGLSKRDQQDVDAIRAAIARLEAQLNHPNADRDAIQQSIAHEKKRLALYGQDVAEGLGSKLAGLGLAGAMALGSAGANARVTPGDDPNINRLTGKPNVTQVAPGDVKPAASAGFNKEWLQKAADPNRVGRYMISVEKAQELLNKMNAVDEEKKKGADGKACWKNYRYAGTENGKDKCVPVGEDVENIMGALIENLIRK